jgi:hypothetical protein
VHSSIVTDATTISSQPTDSIETPSEILNAKYLIYDPRVGRMHNQLRALSVALVFARSLNRTVIIPPLDDGVDFADYFDVAHLRQSGLKFLTWSALRTARCAAHSVTVDSVGMASTSSFLQFLCSEVAASSAWSYFPRIPQNDPDMLTVSLTELGRQVHDVSIFRRQLRRQHINATQTFMLLDGLPFYYCKHASGHPLFFSWPVYLRPVLSIRQAAAAYVQSQFGARPYVALHSRSMHVFCNAQLTIPADQCQPTIQTLVQTVSNTIRTNFSDLIDAGTVSIHFQSIVCSMTRYNLLKFFQMANLQCFCRRIDCVLRMIKLW